MRVSRIVVQVVWLGGVAVSGERDREIEQEYIYSLYRAWVGNNEEENKNYDELYDILYHLY